MNKRLYELLRDIRREKNEEQQEAMMIECLEIMAGAARHKGEEKILAELGNLDLAGSIWALAGAILGASFVAAEDNPIVAALKAATRGGPVELVSTIVQSPYSGPLMFSILMIMQALMEEGEEAPAGDQPA